jgi:hypothetical protein
MDVHQLLADGGGSALSSVIGVSASKGPRQGLLLLGVGEWFDLASTKRLRPRDSGVAYSPLFSR